MTRAGTVTMTQRPDLPTSTTVVRLDSPRVTELLHSTGLARYLTVGPDLPGALVARLAPTGAGSREGTH